MRKSYPGPKETERLWLMPPEEGDADAVAEALRSSLAQWLRWTSASQAKAVEEMRKVAAAAGRSNVRIPSDVDQHSELMSITIPK